MKVPASWLKKYVPISIALDELAHRLTMAGIEVGEVDELGANWERDKVVVGRVIKVEPHPNADRLTLPSVDLGDGDTATVVCGAPNVAAGQKIAFAREGARLVSPRSGEVEPLKAARIRGVVSSGMVCSALELGLGEDHEGILVLDEDAPVGTPLVDYMGDAVLDIDVTPNRPDCLSVLGVAHEVAALTGEKVTEPDLSYAEEGKPIESEVRIEITDPDLCYRYTASLIQGITIGPSPQWLQDTLNKVGQRPINNVVDITNYVMLEYGQPLHAFDFAAVKEKTVVVRAARPGEALVTLDGEKRTLTPPMLAIADATDAIGLAGVMGGVGSQMREGTSSVLLESANFSPTNTRRTARALRLSTEASHRFERGIRAELAPLALRRATQLILQIAGGKAAQGIVDLYPGENERPAVKVSRGRMKQVLGVDLGMDKVAQVLVSLGFERTKEPEGLIDLVEAVEAGPSPERDSTLWMNAPYWRSDVNIEDDLVEEVARIIGYDAIPTTMLSASIPHHDPQPMRTLKEGLQDLLAAAGMREVVSYSLTSLDALDKVKALDDGPGPLKVANPMSGELEYLRTSLRGSVLQTLSSNRRISQGDGIRIFELGRVYLPGTEAKERELPEEREMLVGALSGPRFRDSWLADRENMGYFDAKGVVDPALSQLGMPVDYEPATDPILKMGRTARLVSGGTVVGLMGEVLPEVLARYDIEESSVALFEIDLASLLQATPQAGRRYQTTSRYPESSRDLALVVHADVESSRVQAIIEGHKLVVRTMPFDVYVGEEISPGRKSVAYRVVFQSNTATLTSGQVDRAPKGHTEKARARAGRQTQRIQRIVSIGERELQCCAPSGGTM